MPVIVTDFSPWANRISRCLEVTFSNPQKIIKKGRIVLKIVFTWSAASVSFCYLFFMVLLFRVGMTQGSSIIVNSPQITKMTLKTGKMNPLK